MNLSGCSSTPSSTEVVTIAPTEIESKIKGESQMQGANVTVQIADKTVTLTGITHHLPKSRLLKASPRR
jgi:osmotically-inducible protein OsmY